MAPIVFEEAMRAESSILVVFALAIAGGQPTFVRPRSQPPKPAATAPPELLDPDQSSVYMQFTKTGRCPPADPGKKIDRVWLVLKNNTRWPITVRANGVANDCYGEASPFYRVEADEYLAPEGPIPYGHWLDVGSLVEIESGGVLRFSVPRGDLDPGLSIRVDYEFSWEKDKRYTRHSTYFGYWDLPDRLRDKTKEKKLKCVWGGCIAKPEPVLIPVPPALPPTPLPQLEMPRVNK